MTQNVIKNKRCIVISPSGYLKGRGKLSSQFIDSFDLVVKTTDTCEVFDPEFELGKRCDIWYGLPKSSSGWEVNLQLLKQNNVKLMIFQPCLPKYESTWHDYIDWFLQQNKDVNLSYEIADKENYLELKSLVSSIPFTGLFAIHDLLHRGAAQVFAYGFDFYRSGYFQDLPVGDGAYNNTWHKPMTQMAFMLDLIQKEQRFDCDDNLHDLLKRDFGQSNNFDDIKLITRKELKFFLSPAPNDDLLILRSCRESVFEIIHEAILDIVPEQNIHIICQSDYLHELITESSSVYRIEDGANFNYQALEFLLSSLKHRKFKTCLLPYNGLALHTYFDILKFIATLGIEEVLLVSLRGTIKRLDNINELCQKIERYLLFKDEFRLLQERYDRRNVF